MENIYNRIREIRGLIEKNDKRAVTLINESIAEISEESKDAFAGFVLDGMDPVKSAIMNDVREILGRERNEVEIANRMLSQSKESMLEVFQRGIIDDLPHEERYKIMDKAIRLSILSKDMSLICSIRLLIGGKR